MNPNSQSLVEVGTRLHPYKDLESVFVEILNFHSDQERNLTVYVMEGTTVFGVSPIYISNVTHVQVESYTDTNLEGGIARLVGLTNSSKIISSTFPTKFNILGKNFRVISRQ